MTDANEYDESTNHLYEGHNYFGTLPAINHSAKSKDLMKAADLKDHTQLRRWLLKLKISPSYGLMEAGGTKRNRFTWKQANKFIHLYREAKESEETPKATEADELLQKMRQLIASVAPDLKRVKDLVNTVGKHDLEVSKFKRELDHRLGTQSHNISDIESRIIMRQDALEARLNERMDTLERELASLSLHARSRSR